MCKFENNRFVLTDERFEISNLEAKAKLDDLYFNLEEEEGSLFSVKKIDRGFEVDFLSVNEYGQVNAEKFEKIKRRKRHKSKTTC